MIILQSKITGTQTSFSNNKFGHKPSFILSFPFPERLHYCCYIYFHYPSTCTIILSTLKPCASVAWFQHFILRFNKISLYDWKKGYGVKAGPKTGCFSYLTKWCASPEIYVYNSQAPCTNRYGSGTVLVEIVFKVANLFSMKGQILVSIKGSLSNPL
jgi:hypothetical protein